MRTVPGKDGKGNVSKTPWLHVESVRHIGGGGAREAMTAPISEIFTNF